MFWNRAKVPNQTNPTICSYRPAEIVKKFHNLHPLRSFAKAVTL
jgi:hypothetical protein